MQDRHQERLKSAAIATILCTLLAATGTSQATVQSGSGANAPANATGVYEIIIATGPKGNYRTLALVDRGRLVDVHTKRGATYLARKTGSPSIRLASKKFDELITIAGGINRNVNNMAGTTRNSFYQVAGLTGAGEAAGQPPMQVPPENNACPLGYQPKLQFIDGRKQVQCVIVTMQSPRIHGDTDLLVATTGSAAVAVLDWFVPPAHARKAEIVIKVTIGWDGYVSFTYQDDIGSGTELALRVAGATITWLD